MANAVADERLFGSFSKKQMAKWEFLWNNVTSANNITSETNPFQLVYEVLNWTLNIWTLTTSGEIKLILVTIGKPLETDIFTPGNE